MPARSSRVRTGTGCAAWCASGLSTLPPTTQAPLSNLPGSLAEPPAHERLVLRDPARLETLLDAALTEPLEDWVQS